MHARGRGADRKSIEQIRLICDQFCVNAGRDALSTSLWIWFQCILNVKNHLHFCISFSLSLLLHSLSCLWGFDQEHHGRSDRLSRFSQQLQQQPDLPLADGGPWGPETAHPLWEGGTGWGWWSVSRTFSFCRNIINLRTQSNVSTKICIPSE